MRRVPLGLLLLVLAGCAAPKPPLPDPREMAAAETALLGEAKALRRCMKENGNLPERCRAERQVYEGELSAFRRHTGTADEAD
jgi:hypothetical protein